VIRAAQDVREQLRARAAKIWAIGIECVGWEDGCAVPLGGAAQTENGARKPLSLIELAAKMAQTGGPIVGRAAVSMPMAGPGFAAHMRSSRSIGNRRSTVVRYTAIQDGAAVPRIVEGRCRAAQLRHHGR
jgi:hypothetical protein